MMAEMALLWVCDRREPGVGKNLPPGYRLDLITDPDVLALKREDGSIVARFSAMGADEEEIRRIAWEDYEKRFKYE